MKIITDYCAVGLGSSILRVLNHLYYNKNQDLLYFFIKNKFYGDDNIWNSFFKQPYEDQKRLIEQLFIKNEYTERDIWDTGKWTFGYGDIWNANNDFLQEARDLFERYIIFKPEIIKKAQKIYNLNFLNQKVLGLHKRGTDHLIVGHGRGQYALIDTNFLCNVIDKKIKNYDKIFLATDEQKFIDELTKVYGTKIIKSSAKVTPIGSLESVHESNQNESAAERYNIGVDMLVDAILLSKCDYHLAMTSNVSIVSILMRKDNNYEFFDKHLDYSH